MYTSTNNLPLNFSPTIFTYTLGALQQVIFWVYFYMATSQLVGHTFSYNYNIKPHKLNVNKKTLNELSTIK